MAELHFPQICVDSFIGHRSMGVYYIKQKAKNNHDNNPRKSNVKAITLYLVEPVSLSAQQCVSSWSSHSNITDQAQTCLHFGYQMGTYFCNIVLGSPCTRVVCGLCWVVSPRFYQQSPRSSTKTFSLTRSYMELHGTPPIV